MLFSGTFYIPTHEKKLTHKTKTDEAINDSSLTLLLKAQMFLYPPQCQILKEWYFDLLSLGYDYEKSMKPQAYVMERWCECLSETLS